MAAPFRTLAVLGAGNMGSGIAQKMATEGFDVVLVDVDDKKVARGVSTIERTLREAVDRGIMRSDKILSIRDRIHGTSRFDDLRSEEHTSELQSRGHLVCRLLLEKKNK